LPNRTESWISETDFSIQDIIIIHFLKCGGTPIIPTKQESEQEDYGPGQPRHKHEAVLQKIHEAKRAGCMVKWKSTCLASMKL
jgi:hypothetical protein